VFLFSPDDLSTAILKAKHKPNRLIVEDKKSLASAYKYLVLATLVKS